MRLTTTARTRCLASIHSPLSSRPSYCFASLNFPQHTLQHPFYCKKFPLSISPLALRGGVVVHAFLAFSPPSFPLLSPIKGSRILHHDIAFSVRWEPGSRGIGVKLPLYREGKWGGKLGYCASTLFFLSLLFSPVFHVPFLFF